MDATLAERLASSIDPKALAQLQSHSKDPAVGRAVAAQFGSYLMQGLLQDNSGKALPMAGGVGSGAVNAMFASVMGRAAMSGDQLGLADTIYKSIEKQQQQVDTRTTKHPAPTPVPTHTNSVAPSHGISLSPYWQDHGHRPVGTTISHVATKPPSQAPATSPARSIASTRKTTPRTDASAATASSTTVPPPHRDLTSPTPPDHTAQATTAAAPRHAPAPHWQVLTLPVIGRILMPTAQNSPPTTQASGTHPNNNTNAVGEAPTQALPWSHHWTTDAAPAKTSDAAPASRAATVADAEQFAHNMEPALHEAAARLGVSPRVLLAQAALETGWGHSVVGNNIFGVKAGTSWSGGKVTAPTHEMIDGHLVMQSGRFRSYANVTQAVDDYVSLVSASSRYRSAMDTGNNVVAYAHALAAGGYATDSDYAAKLVAVANSPKMAYAVASLDGTEPGQSVSAHG